jgi:mannosyltransferase OCH1-like enzyme
MITLAEFLRYLGDDFAKPNDVIAIGAKPDVLEERLSQYNFRSKIVRALLRVAHGNPVAQMSSPTAEIDKTIIQYWDDGAPPPDVVDLQKTWGLKNPDFAHAVYDSKMARAFLEGEFSADVLEAFDYCHHPVLRADFFRYFYLYARGGFYVDSDEECLSPVGEILNNNYSAILATRCTLFAEKTSISPADALKDNLTTNTCGYYIVNAPLIISARHEIMRMMTEKVLIDFHLAKKESRQVSILDTTSPPVFTSILLKYALSGDAGANIASLNLMADWLGRYSHEHALAYKKTAANWRKA